jgi:hypothetical protein
VKLQKLLVPVDFSLGSETACKYAKFLAKTFSGSIHSIHVVDKRYVEKIAELNGESGTGHGLSFDKSAVEIHEGVVGYEPTPPREQLLFHPANRGKSFSFVRSCEGIFAGPRKTKNLRMSNSSGPLWKRFVQ